MINSARKWDELRIANVVPSKISTLPLSIEEHKGVGGLFKVLGFNKDWLRIEGLEEWSLFRAQNFEFASLDYPHEWSANLLPSDKEVLLRVGSECKCTFSGLAAYAKSDNTAWVRLHFEQCTGCESTASRAAVVVGLQPSAGLDSNLYAWMCAVYPHGSCTIPTDPTSTETSSTVTTTHPPATTSTATTTQEVIVPTTTTVNAACVFLSVSTHTESLGQGKCKHHHGEEKNVNNEKDCRVACDLLYIWEEQHYGSTEELNSNIDEINAKSHVCKGYAYNDASKQCIIYTDGAVHEANGEEDWVCFGEVRVDSNGFAYHYDYTSEGCTTKAPPLYTTVTETTTKTTVTVTTTRTKTTSTQTETSTTTTPLEVLSLMPLFGSADKDARVFGFPSDVHYQRDGMEATMMQLQSQCFEDVDYYMLGGTLPVAESSWDHLMHVLKHFGSTTAWSDASAKCRASATIDRIPVDVDVSKERSSGGLSSATKLVCTVVAASVVSLLGAFLALWTRGKYYPLGIMSPALMSGLSLVVYICIAIIAAVVTFAVVYGLGLFACWFAGRLAAKRISLGGSGNFLLVSPLLSKLCLPVAGTAAGAMAVVWLWPSPARRTDKHQKENLLFSYNPVTNDIQPIHS